MSMIGRAIGGGLSPAGAAGVVGLGLGPETTGVLAEGTVTGGETWLTMLSRIGKVSGDGSDNKLDAAWIAELSNKGITAGTGGTGMMAGIAAGISEGIVNLPRFQSMLGLRVFNQSNPKAKEQEASSWVTRNRKRSEMPSGSVKSRSTK